MSEWQVQFALTLGSMLISIGVVYGMIKAKVDKVENDIKTLFMVRDGMNERYVTYQYFHEVISQIKENQRDLQQDVKQLISMVGKINGSS